MYEEYLNVYLIKFLDIASRLALVAVLIIWIENESKVKHQWSRKLFMLQLLLT